MGVRVPYTPRPLLTPVTTTTVYATPTLSRRPVSSNRPLQHRASFAEKLVGHVLEKEGLGDYVSPTVVRAAEIEIAETFNVPSSELESAAAALLARQQQTDARYVQSAGELHNWLLRLTNGL
jgi:hypothetical protein